LDQSNESAVMEKENEHLTRGGFVAWIGQPRAFESQFLLMAKGANPPEGKFLGAVTCLETSVMEFSYLLDQSGQAWCHLWLSPLIIDEWWEQMPVHPLRLDVHIN
jgi:hypothetical protein